MTQNFLGNFSPGERRNLKSILSKISAEDLGGLFLERLKSRHDIFRVTSGNMRVLYRQREQAIDVLAVERNHAV
jgi:hypothetical protein